MDIHLGRNKKNGIETAKAIRSNYKVPVIFITGYDLEVFQPVEFDEATSFMRKPEAVR